MRVVLGGLLGILAAGALGFFVIAWWPEIPPVPLARSQTFPSALIARGAMLAGAGYCAVCHTAADGQPDAGGYGLATPFGVIYSANDRVPPRGVGAVS